MMPKYWVVSDGGCNYGINGPVFELKVVEIKKAVRECELRKGEFLCLRPQDIQRTIQTWRNCSLDGESGVHYDTALQEAHAMADFLNSIAE